MSSSLLLGEIYGALGGRAPAPRFVQRFPGWSAATFSTADFNSSLLGHGIVSVSVERATFCAQFQWLWGLPRERAREKQEDC